MESRKGGIVNWSIRKLGTPSGAGPKLATVSVGLAFVGTPLGSRVGCCGTALRFSPELEVPPLVAPPATPWPPEPPGPAGPAPPPPPVLPPPVPVPPVPVPPVPSPGGGGGGGGSVSSVSSGPEQPGSARSVRPSASSSFRFEQAGSELTGGRSFPPGRLAASPLDDC